MRKDSNQPHRRCGSHPAPARLADPEVILDAAEAVAAQGFDALTHAGGRRAARRRADGALQPLRDQGAARRRAAGPRAGPLRAAPRDGRLDRGPRRFARAHRRLLVAHPWAVAPLFTQPNPGLGAVRIGEHALGILRRGGLSDARAVAAFSGVDRAQLRLVVVHRPRATSTPAARATTSARCWPSCPPRRVPAHGRRRRRVGAYGSDAPLRLRARPFLRASRRGPSSRPRPPRRRGRRCSPPARL